MSVKYSLLWLALSVGLVIAAVFPYVIYVLRDLLDIEMPVKSGVPSDVLLCAGGATLAECGHQPAGGQISG